MAAAKKCDRCGNFYERNTGKSICGEYVSKIELRSNHNMLKAYDFCDDCIYKFQNFMKCEPEVEQGSASCQTCKFYDKDLSVCTQLETNCDLGV